jgi:hypothetical protein
LSEMDPGTVVFFRVPRKAPTRGQPTWHWPQKENDDARRY